MAAPESSLIGTSVLRKEDVPLLTGGARFIADLDRPHTAHAFVVRSYLAHARLVSVDVSAALEAPGVTAALTRDDLPEDLRIPLRMHRRAGLDAFLQPPLARETVRYAGEPVAILVAESRYAAEDAAELVAIEYDELDCVTRADEAGSTASAEWVTQTGDVAAAFAAAHTVVESRVECHRHAAVPLETRGLLAEVDDLSGVLTLYGAAKVPHVNRRILARLLGWAEERIRLVELHVGGGFGARGEFYPEDFLIPLLATRLGRPVLWVEDRRENLLACNHSREQIHEVALALDADGTFLALSDRLLNDAGAYVRTQGTLVPAMTASLLPGPYRIGAYRCEVSNVMTNKTPAAACRAPGRYEANLARERIIDLAAARLGIDPVELRRRNLITAAEMPYSVGTESDGHPVVYDSGDYPRMLERALERFDYAGMRTWAASDAGPGRRRGLGVIPYVEKSGVAAWEFGGAEVTSAGTIRVTTGATSFGQGLETVLAQICATALGVDHEAVSVSHGDTAAVPDGMGTYGSRSSALAGAAVFVSAGRLRQRILRIAARELEVAVTDLELRGDSVCVHGAPEKRLTLREVFERARAAATVVAGEPPGLVEHEYFVAEEPSFPYGVHCAGVEVDLETGAIEIERYLVTCDVGRAVNPALVEAQLVGGVVQGIGGAVLEQLAYDESGQLLTGSFAGYLLPTAPDVPSIDVLVDEYAPAAGNPLGLKGAGEAGIAAVGATIASAVSAALGVHVTRLPLTPERVAELAATLVPG